MQASVGLTFNFTSFTLSNFSQSFFLNLTNVNGTNVVPAGMSPGPYSVMCHDSQLRTCTHVICYDLPGHHCALRHGLAMFKGLLAEGLRRKIAARVTCGACWMQGPPMR